MKIQEAISSQIKRGAIDLLYIGSMSYIIQRYALGKFNCRKIVQLKMCCSVIECVANIIIWKYHNMTDDKLRYALFRKFGECKVLMLRSIVALAVGTYINFSKAKEFEKYVYTGEVLLPLFLVIRCKAKSYLI